MQTQIKEKLAQAEVFAHKGGKLRAVAKRMREAAQEAEENIVSVRQEDKTIRDFSIPVQDYGQFFDGKVMEFSSVSAVRPHGLVSKQLELVLRKNTHVLISGPNGIGKSTLLGKVSIGQGEGFVLAKGIKIGYYKQDFSNFDFEQKAFEALKEVMEKYDEHILRATAAGFLLDGKLLDQPIAALSEGQKGLLSFCRLALMAPGLLILDEPTNHINFRHLPVIARALDGYEGVSLMVSHIPEFVSQIRIDHSLDLSAL
jgi:ATP-binding cassette subfamily F protein 3